MGSPRVRNHRSYGEINPRNEHPKGHEPKKIWTVKIHIIMQFHLSFNLQNFCLWIKSYPV